MKMVSDYSPLEIQDGIFAIITPDEMFVVEAESEIEAYDKRDDWEYPSEEQYALALLETEGELRDHLAYIMPDEVLRKIKNGDL